MPRFDPKTDFPSLTAEVEAKFPLSLFADLGEFHFEHDLLATTDFEQINDLVGAAVGGGNQFRLAGGFQVVNLAGQGDRAVHILNLDSRFREERLQFFLQHRHRCRDLHIHNLCISGFIPDDELRRAGLLGCEQQIIGAEGNDIGDIGDEDVGPLDPLDEVHLLRLTGLKGDGRDRLIVRGEIGGSGGGRVRVDAGGRRPGQRPQDAVRKSRRGRKC